MSSKNRSRNLAVVMGRTELRAEIMRDFLSSGDIAMAFLTAVDKDDGSKPSGGAVVGSCREL